MLTRTFLAVSLLLLLGCGGSPRHTSFHQAVVRPPPAPTVRPPVSTPGYFPGTPPEPVYTPSGAGLPGERVPGTQAAQPAPRSPNKRVLPASTEPGLWAADGAPQAAIPPGRRKVFGVEIPSGTTLEDQTVAAVCSLGYAAVMEDSPTWKRYIDGWPEYIRRCMAARAFLYCAEELSKQLKAGRLPHPTFGPNAVDSAARRAAMMERSHCAGVELDGRQEATLDGVKRRWVMLDLSPRLRTPPEPEEP